MINIDSVYQKVLVIANKEQRGYITPQEFNLFADHAQKEIFNQYFYDLEQIQRGVGNSLNYADKQFGIEEKISHFEIYDEVGALSTDFGSVFLPDNVYKLGMVRVDYDLPEVKSGFVEAERIQLNELNSISSPLTSWNKKRPVYTIYGDSTNFSGNRLRVYPYPVPPDRVLLSYIRKPKKPNWTYVISNQAALYAPYQNDHQSFELHSSEENNLVIKILQLAGVAIKDFNLSQAAAAKEANTIQQEKQ